MIEAATIDYDRVQSSTATIDGTRIVLTLEADQGPTNISLPLTEVPRLIAAIATGAGVAKEAQCGKRATMALRARRLESQRGKQPGELWLLVELVGGTELVFQADRQVMSQFLSDCVENLEQRSGQAGKILQ
jgi:hypothetical protein